MGDRNGDVIGVGGDHLKGCGAVSDEEIDDAGGDDRTLGYIRVDVLVWGCNREVEVVCFPTGKVGE